MTMTIHVALQIMIIIITMIIMMFTVIMMIIALPMGRIDIALVLALPAINKYTYLWFRQHNDHQNCHNGLCIGDPDFWSQASEERRESRMLEVGLVCDYHDHVVDHHDNHDDDDRIGDWEVGHCQQPYDGGLRQAANTSLQVLHCYNVSSPSSLPLCCLYVLIVILCR